MPLLLTAADCKPATAEGNGPEAAAAGLFRELCCSCLHAVASERPSIAAALGELEAAAQVLCG